jgi:two-component system NtrC family sensor kinase
MNKSLTFKLITLVLVIVIISSMVFVAASVQKSQRVIVHQANSFGRALAKGIARSSTELVKEGQTLKLRRGIEAIGHAFPLIRTITITYDKIKLVEFISDRARSEEKLSRVYTEPIALSVEGLKAQEGRVEIVYSLQEFVKMFVVDLRPFFKSSIVYFFGIMLVLFIIFQFFIMRPIRVLQTGTDIVGDGDLTHIITLKQNDELGELASSFNDMTYKLRLAREEIEEWNRTLEVKVDERTRELEKAHTTMQELQMQLMQSGKLAAVGMVGAEVAHELNNPLSFILGYAQMMHQKVKKGDVPLEKFEKYLDTIVRETKRCAGIVKDISAFSKRSSESFSSLSFRDVIETTVTIMKFQFRKWNMELSTDLTESELIVHGNSDKLQQIFINLIANAHHAMPDGGKLSISLKENVIESQHVAEVRVTDTGSGIPHENIDKLFGSFFSTKQDTHNLGLGLAITLRIVTEHKGRISVESEVGKGTTFIIHIPVEGEPGFIHEDDDNEGGPSERHPQSFNN